MRMDRIKQIITSQFPLATVFELEDESHQHAGRQGQESHFKLLLVSTEFEDLSRVNRQRKMNALMSTEFENGLHALTMRLMTPIEWENSQQKFNSPDCQGGEKL